MISSRQRLNVLALTIFALFFSAYAIFWLPDSQRTYLSEIWGSILGNAEDEHAIFVGDIMMARDVEKKILFLGLNPFEFVSPILNDATAVVGNFEASVPVNHVPITSGQMTFSVRSDLLSLLVDAGFTHLSLANNHSLDHGLAAEQNTVKAINKLGIKTFGRQLEVSPEASVTNFSLGGQTIAMIGMNLVNFHVTPAMVEATLAKAVNESDWQIAYLHWGEEYFTGHTLEQEQFAKLLIDNGADAVIGNHPHVVEDIASYKGAPIFYSLGNFVFDQYFSLEVQQGLMLKMSITNNKLKFDLVPVTSLGTPIQPRLMNEAESNSFLSSLNIDLSLGAD